MGGAMGAGAGTDLTFVNMVVMKDSFEAGLRMLSDMARHPAFAPEEIERQRQQALSSAAGELRGSRVRRRRRVRSAGLRLSSVRHAADRHARDRSPRSRATTWSPFHEQIFRAQQRHSRGRRRRHRRGGVRRRHRRSSATGSDASVPAAQFIAPPEPTRRVIVVNKPDAVQTEVRVGPPRHQAQPPGLHGAEPGDAHPRRRRREPPAPGAAHASAA